MAPENSHRHRTDDLIQLLEERLAQRIYRPGAAMPTVRSISHETGCAHVTAHRAMRELVRRGLVVAEPRQGYRAAGAPENSGTERVCFLEEPEEQASVLGDIYPTQMRMLQKEAIRRGWSVVVMPYTAQPVTQIARDLQAMGATAMILQELDIPFTRDLFSGLGRLNLPIINLNGPYGVPGMDYVLRDEAHGASLAAEYLICKGHRRIGWYGPLRDQYTSRHRYAGAAEVLLREGIDVGAQGWRDVANAESLDVARAYLKSFGKHLPPAVLALTSTSAVALARVALERGLKLGVEIDIVGWSLEENFKAHYQSLCPQLPATCATVTWRMADVARSVFTRIHAHRHDPGLPVASILLPMRLRKPTTCVERSID